jgi:hypothetical protein
LIEKEQGDTYSHFCFTHEFWMPKKMAEEVLFDILSYFSTTMTYKNEA